MAFNEIRLSLRMGEFILLLRIGEIGGSERSVFVLSSLIYGAGDSPGLFAEKLPFFLWVQSLCFLVAARLLFRLSKIVKLKEQVRKTHD